MKVDKLTFMAPLGKGDIIKGYHVTSKEIIRYMVECGLDLRVHNLDHIIIPEFKALQEKDEKDRFILLREIPTVWPKADGFYTVTEFNQPTYGSISPIYKSKLTITESEFCKKVYEKYSDNEVAIIQSPIDKSFTPEGPKYNFEGSLNDFSFKFLAVFEWIMRKDPYSLIAAFCSEFDPKEDVCLIIRCWSVFENPRKWIGMLAKNHNVFWLEKRVEDMSALYRSCDCQVSSTLGEGFGRTYVESMACGMLNILPNATAISEYANPSNAIMIETKEDIVGNRVNELAHLIKPYFKIQVPDREELKKAMRYVYENNCDDLKNEALKIRERFNIENTKNQIREAFEL